VTNGVVVRSQSLMSKAVDALVRIARLQSRISKAVEALGRTDISDLEAVEVFVNTTILQKLSPVLIVDEANSILWADDRSGATKSSLASIVALTKQQRQFDLIMASWDYTFPNMLEKNGVNLNDISDIFFETDMPPKSMWELLVTKKDNSTGTSKLVIGMGANLAFLLIDSYGGHFMNIEESVYKLLQTKEMFAAADMLLPMSNDIKKCIYSYGNTTQI
jgi:hypothetical protein